MNSYVSKTKVLFENFIEFVYPPRCLICQKLTGIGKSKQLICDSCLKKLKFIDNVPLHFDKLTFHGEEIMFDLGYAVFKYETVKPLIEAFKFSRMKPLGKYIAQFMHDFALQENVYDGIELLVPIPISKERMLERGFNQTAVMAEYISNISGIKMSEALKRQRDTVAQFKIRNAGKRIKNIKGAFVVKEDVKDKNILLIEDIFTTGATLNECALTLKKAGANRVDFLAFSIST
ncbi:MAG: ComF family protein [Clostridia bacterium]|jgi:ComF family protein|nr:ComF family protein [Clostridia bacterium]MCI2000116.1 ComF family protein [Clostridia bacterium]MCI2014719.1 ComF family protein [Clostridia bacterium]